MRRIIWAFGVFRALGPLGSRSFLAAGAFAALLGCGGGAAQPTNASPSCYPSCIQTLLEECPLQGTCEGTVGLTSATVCYANGVKVQDTLITGPETVVVKGANGQACYTVSQTSTAGTPPRTYSVTVNGQVVASITNNQAADNTATIFCGDLPTKLTFPKPGADCQPLWWNDEQRCTSGTCSF